MFGDRLSTDMTMAHRAGIDSAFVLTGCNTVDDIERPAENPEGVKPTYILDSFGSFKP